MSILVEFSIDPDQFTLGEHIAQHDGLKAELERIVPTNTHTIPYVWVTGPPETLDALTETFEQSPAIAQVTTLDRVTTKDSEQNKQLYRLDWYLEELDLIAAIRAADGIVLEGGSSDGRWSFRFRFPDHDHVSQFYQHLVDHEIIKFTIDSIYELETHADKKEQYDLTPAQREALTLAAERGYFSTPRVVTLDELAEELDISEQAISQRIRRATEKVILAALDHPDAGTT